MSLYLWFIVNVPFDKNTNKNIFFYFLTSHQYVSVVVIIKLTIHFKVLEYRHKVIILLRQTWVTPILEDFCPTWEGFLVMPRMLYHVQVWHFQNSVSENRVWVCEPRSKQVDSDSDHIYLQTSIFFPSDNHLLFVELCVPCVHYPVSLLTLPPQAYF